VHKQQVRGRDATPGNQTGRIYKTFFPLSGPLTEGWRHIEEKETASGPRVEWKEAHEDCNLFSGGKECIRLATILEIAAILTKERLF